MTDGAAAAHDGPSRLGRWGDDVRELLGSGFFQAVLGTLGSKAALLALSVVTAVIVTRALGPEGRGFYATAVAVSAIGVQLGNMGLHASNTWVVARDRSLLGTLIANSLLASVVIGGLIVSVALLVMWVWPEVSPLDPGLMALALVSIPIGLSYLLIQNLLLGTDRIRAYNGLELANRAAATVLLVALVLAGVITAFSAFAVAVVLTGLAGLIAVSLLTRGTSVRLRTSRTLMLEHARYGLKAYLAAMASFLLLRVDVLIVQSMLGAEQTGYYAVAVSLADNIYLLPIVVGTLLFPRLTAIAEPMSQWRMARSATIGLGIVMLVIVVTAGLVAQPVIRILFGDAFLPAVPPLIWLLPGIVLISVNTPLMNYFAAIGMPLVVIIGPLLALALNVPLNLWLIPSLGIAGAAVASSISYGLMLLVSVTYLYRRHP